MMEPFRSVIVDAVVLKLIKHQHLLVTDFSVQNGACYLSTKAKQIFVAAIEQQLSKQLSYQALAIQTDYRRIMDLQILLLKQHIMDDSTEFKPFTIR